MSVTFVSQDDRVHVPLGDWCLGDFRRWAASDAFPERGRIDYIRGKMEVDMSPEDLHTHGKVKTELIGVLWQRIKREGLGEVYTDRARVSSVPADVSAEPDLVFVSEASLDSGRVRLVPKAGGQRDRYVELEGSPDLIVEIISDSSVEKDTEELPLSYYEAGVAEYWLVDARGEQLLFRIHGRGPSRFEPVPVDAEGFQHSAVLDRRYRLDRSRNDAGRVVFDLREKQP